MALAGKLTMVLFILLDAQHRTLMYFMLSQLSLMDLIYNCTTVPKKASGFLFGNKSISFIGCEVQGFFFAMLASSEGPILRSMAYDCYMAICFPLHYPICMNRRVCVLMILGSWAMASVNSCAHIVYIFCIPYCSRGQGGGCFCTILTPMLNPVIYNLRNKEVQGALGRVTEKFHSTKMSHDAKHGSAKLAPCGMQAAVGAWHSSPELSTELSEDRPTQGAGLVLIHLAVHQGPSLPGDFKRVMVLEAKGNVGGRIEAHCISRSDWYIELGSMRFHVIHRMSSEFIQKSGLKLMEFCSCDNHSWVLVNRVLQHLGAVQANPDLLGYLVRAHEARKMTEQLFNQSLMKVMVLEAKGNVGGRIEAHCISRSDWYIELGSMRFHVIHRMSSEFIQKSGLKLMEFCSCDNHSWVLVNRVLQHLGAVQANPDLLGYLVRAHEARKMTEQLFNQSLMKVEEELKGSSCLHMLEKFDSFSTKEYLVKVGNLSHGVCR
ncbi:Olfactory receptor 2L2 [Heterocephalus glaber]|uniref:Olfactory receptor 2L2 n=1 Tax=Heterocephalus glaber TaxID=10181 RepID=G5ALM9_HETGA|nr:Olfactory receptor 2L2 [Heterocephalus glaber]